MHDEERVHITGVIESVVFQNEGNGYAVLRVTADGGGELTVVGSFPFAGAGEEVAVEGQWSRHPTYGEQLQALTVERKLPTSEAGILKYLQSGGVRGIGPVTGARVVQTYGARSFDIIAHFPDKLVDIPGITRKKAETISREFSSQMSLRSLLEYLAGYDVPPAVALKLHQWYGAEAAAFVQRNPYILSDAEVGVNFGVCDHIAAETGMERDADERVDAGVLYELEHNVGNGHVFLPNGKLYDATAQFLGVDASLVERAVARLTESGRIFQTELKDKPVAYLSRLYDDEAFTADRIRLLCEGGGTPAKGVKKFLASLEKTLGITYADNQREAIELAARNRLFLLTGGPGTGKTTSVRGMLALFDHLGWETMLAAPTGRAAKRLSELCGREAKTIHRLLGVKFTEGSPGHAFKHGESEPLPCDVLVLDEMSMVDISLFASLLRALKPSSRLVLVGDPDQLPSVGPGNVLSDMLKSARIPRVMLNDIFRQATQSNIVLGAHAVNRGECPELRHKTGDFFFMRRAAPEEILETVRGLCKTRLPQNMEIPPSDIQVLTPTRKGPLGTAGLNRMLQEALNPPAEGKPEKAFSGKTFRLGDRVMHIKNNYDLPYRGVSDGAEGLGVFNGDIGVICDVDLKREILSVLYDDRLVDYPFDLLGELELAYACTVHKSQGSEYRAVVLALADAPPQLLCRPVLYTAMTRASDLLIVVGDDARFGSMIENNRRLSRYSGLRFRL